MDRAKGLSGVLSGVVVVVLVVVVAVGAAVESVVGVDVAVVADAVVVEEDLGGRRKIWTGDRDTRSALVSRVFPSKRVQ